MHPIQFDGLLATDVLMDKSKECGIYVSKQDPEEHQSHINKRKERTVGMYRRKKAEPIRGRRLDRNKKMPKTANTAKLKAYPHDNDRRPRIDN